MSRYDLVPSDIVGLITTPPVSRRTFMSATAAATAGYTLATGPVSAQAIATSTEGLDTGDGVVTVGRGSMPVYFARPKGVEKAPVVIVAMEIFGLHEYIKDVTRRIAQLGAFAIAPNYYFTMGDLTRITEVDKLRPLVNAKPDAELMADLDAAVDWATGQGGDSNKLGITGFCRGGRTVWLYCAHSTTVKAGVAFYGSLIDPPSQKPIWPKSPTELAAEMKAPVLGLYGGADQGIPISQVEAMQAALKAAGKIAEFKIYPDAPHAFHADYRPSYRKDAAADAFTQMHEWFRTHKVLN